MTTFVNQFQYSKINHKYKQPVKVYESNYFLYTRNTRLQLSIYSIQKELLKYVSIFMKIQFSEVNSINITAHLSVLLAQIKLEIMTDDKVLIISFKLNQTFWGLIKNWRDKRRQEDIFLLMAWKFRKEHPKVSRETYDYVPFTYQEESQKSPFYRFTSQTLEKEQQMQPPKIKQHDIIHSSQTIPCESDEYLQDDFTIEDLGSSELLEMRGRVKERGRRNAIVQGQGLEMGILAEEIFNMNLRNKSIHDEVEEQQNKKSSCLNNTNINEIQQNIGMNEVPKYTDLKPIPSNRQFILKHKKKENENGEEKQMKTLTKLQSKDSIQSKQESSSQQFSDMKSDNFHNTSVLGRTISLSRISSVQKIIKTQGAESKEDENRYYNEKIGIITDRNQSIEDIIEYLENTILKRGSNIKKGLRQVFVLYKKFKSSFYTLQIEKFFIPVYTHIIDHQDLLKDFIYWKEYLSQKMKLAKHQMENVFTSNGFRLINLSQIPPSENIIILQGFQFLLTFIFQLFVISILISWEGRLENVFRIQTNVENLLNFIAYQYISTIYCIIFSLGQMLFIEQKDKEDENTLQLWHEFQQSQNLQLSMLAYKYFIGYLNGLKNTEEIYKTFLSTTLINNVIFEYERNCLSVCNDSEIRKQSQNSSLQLPNINKNRKQKFTDSNPNSFSTNNNTLQQQKSKQLITLEENQNSQSTILKDRLQLVDLYSQYQNIMISSHDRKISNPNKSPSFTQGALIRKFNGLKMKILQQSFPYLARKKASQATKSNNFNPLSKITSFPNNPTNFSLENSNLFTF